MNTNKFLYLIHGIILGLVMFVILGATPNTNNEGQVGRYQIVSSAQMNHCYTILDTKTGIAKIFVAGKMGGGGYKMSSISYVDDKVEK